MLSLMTIIGSLALAGGSIGYVTFPMGLEFGIKTAINLAENGMVFPLYMKPPIKAQSTFYVFAIKNPREVLKGGKMSLELKGPYKFMTEMTREKISFSESGQKVAFDTGRQLAPDEAHSANFDEKMWLVNPIIPQGLRLIRKLILDRIPFRRLSEPIVFNTANVLLDAYKERLILRITPRVLLDGRRIELLDALVNLADRFGLATLLPPGPPANTFGLVFVQNRTIDAMEIYTGVGETRDRFGEVTKFRNAARMPFWRGKCNSIEGTNGELYKPFLAEGEPIRVFLAPLCRSFDMDPVLGNATTADDLSSESTYNGIPLVESGSGVKGLEYKISDRLFKGARSNPNNLCFCENTRSYDCQYDGLVTMGPCFFDAPLFFTRGNFKGVDPRIKNLIDWESSNTSDPKTGRQVLSEEQSFKIEPLTGTVLEANITLVGLIKVVRQPYMRDIANVQNLTYAPLFATTETISLPFKFIWQIYLLQKLNDNHKLIMAGTALSGAGTLALKFFFF